jgi:hypothetical protein
MSNNDSLNNNLINNKDNNIKIGQKNIKDTIINTDINNIRIDNNINKPIKSYNNYKEYLLSDEGLKKIEYYASIFDTNIKIYNALNISNEFFYRLKNDSVEFANALNRGRAATIEKMAQNLIKAGSGHIGIDTITETNEKGTFVKTIERYIAPDTKAITYYLNNKAPDEFKPDKNIINLSTNISMQNSLPDKTTEINDLLSALMAKPADIEQIINK